MVWLGGRALAGEYGVTSWGVDEGLPQSSVTDIAQSADGFLWIRSLNSSLSRFDGVQFVNFDTANLAGLDSPAIRRLFVDNQGTLWVNDETDNLLVWQGHAFVKVGENLRLASLVGESPGHLALMTLDGDLVIGRSGPNGAWSWQRHKLPPPKGYFVYHEDRDGVLWFSTPGGKLGRFANDRFEILDAPPGLANGKIQTLARDADGQIWVGTDQELARWQGAAFINENPGGPATKISFAHLVPDRRGGLWVEANGKLVFFGHNHWSEPVAEWDRSRLPWVRVSASLSDNVGGLWISLGEQGMVHVDHDRKLVRVTTADGLPSQSVQAFFADREGNLWAGYHRGGLIQARQQTFHSLTRREGLRDTLVTSVTEDTAGAIWVGTAGGTVACWADGVCTNFSLPRSGAVCRDAVVAAGFAGQVWVGTVGNGLLVWDHGQFQPVLGPDKISPDGVRQLLVAKNGDVWFANFSGLYRWRENKLDQVLVLKSKQEVAALMEGTDGPMWIGTLDGKLHRWQDGKLLSYQPLDGVPDSRFWALYPEPDGTIWIGTMNAGLLRFKDGRFTRFTVADGLANNSISHILADDQNNLWLGSHVGVMCVAKSSLVPRDGHKPAVACRLFGRTDGLPTVAMTLEFQPSCVKAHDGSLWFGSPKGANWVNPAEIRPAEPAPPLLVESVSADGLGQEFIRNPPSASPAIFIEPGAKNIEVNFTAPAFTAPDLMRFKYRLDKLDADWIDVGGQRSVSFKHLPAGDYNFRVMAQNSDGLWSQPPATFRLVLQPHLWERSSFQLSALAALLGLVGFTVRRIMQQRFRRKLEALRQQQQIERERARIARELHDDLGAGLTEISMTSDLVENPDLPEYEKNQYAHEVGVRARELVQRMDEIVWAVNPLNDSLASLSLYVSQYAKQFLDLSHIACRVDLQPDLPEITLNAEQRYNFFLAFKEAINNIARHAKAKELHLAIRSEQGRLAFIIKDDGRGFEPGGELAGADGLRNIRERMSRLKGECEITSQPGRGTRVSLWIPLQPA